jgi:hypothetical protein
MLWALAKEMKKQRRAVIKIRDVFMCNFLFFGHLKFPGVYSINYH